MHTIVLKQIEETSVEASVRRPKKSGHAQASQIETTSGEMPT